MRNKVKDFYVVMRVFDRTVLAKPFSEIKKTFGDFYVEAKPFFKK